MLLELDGLDPSVTGTKLLRGPWCWFSLLGTAGRRGRYRSSKPQRRQVPAAVGRSPAIYLEQWGSRKEKTLSWSSPSLSLKRQPSQLPTVTGCLNLLFPLSGMLSLASHNLLPHFLQESSLKMLQCSQGISYHSLLPWPSAILSWCELAYLYLYCCFVLLIGFCLPAFLRPWLIEGHKGPSNTLNPPAAAAH